MTDTPHPDCRSSATIAAVVSQHAEEAAFQWLLRSRAVHAPHYSLKDLAKLDDIVDAHLDGLRIAGDAGWEICRQELSWEEPGEVFAAAYLAGESGDADRLGAVRAAVVKTPATAAGLASALGWLAWEQARPHVQALLGSTEPDLRRAGLAAAAIHRQDPGTALNDALSDPDPSVVCRALRAAGELGRRDLLPACRNLVGSSDPDTAFRAAWAATLLGDIDAVDSLVSIAESGGPHAEQACLAAARRLDPNRAMAWRRLLAADEHRLRLAILAVGACGDPQQVPWLLEMAVVDAQARPAGEALALITGLDLAYLDLDRDQPADFAAGPTEDADDESVDLDPDEDLPWPDPKLLTAWWAQHGRRFKAGQRYLLGEVMTEENLQKALRSGRQRQRAAAALELTLRQPGRPLFEVRARGDRQRRLLGA